MLLFSECLQDIIISYFHISSKILNTTSNFQPNIHRVVNTHFIYTSFTYQQHWNRINKLNTHFVHKHTQCTQLKETALHMHNQPPTTLKTTTLKTNKKKQQSSNKIQQKQTRNKQTTVLVALKCTWHWGCQDGRHTHSRTEDIVLTLPVILPRHIRASICTAV